MLLCPAAASAQHEEMQQLATQLAGDIHRAGKRSVAVADFAGPENGFTNLGHVLSLELAASLAWTGKGLNLTRTPLLQAVLTTHGLTPKEQDDPRAVRNLAERANVETLVLGWIEAEAVRLKLTARLFTADGTLLREAQAFLPRTPAVEELLARRQFPLVNPRANEARSCERFGAGVFTPGRDGVSAPRCADCPNPPYTDEARKEKISAIVLLSLVVTAQGRAEQISVARRAGYGLDDNAVKAVREWRFSPATNRDGKPVATCITTEVAFRIR
jgi:TonB family protein